MTIDSEQCDLLFSNDTTSDDVGANSRAWRRTLGLGHIDAHWGRLGSEASCLGLLVTILATSPVSYATLGTREEEDAALKALQEISSDVTSWEVHDEDDRRLAGVVAPRRHRREIFRLQVDITPGKLPRRRPRFAFLDVREEPDDE